MLILGYSDVLWRRFGICLCQSGKIDISFAGNGIVVFFCRKFPKPTRTQSFTSRMPVQVVL